MMFQTFFVGFVSARGTMQQAFTSNQVIALTGITPRQLQWWDERGIVIPAREGHKRIYSLDDLAEVAVICELRERGFSLQKIRLVVRFLQKELGKRLVETVTAASEYHLLTDGRHIYLEDSARAVVDLLKNARQPMLTVCLSDTIQRVLHPLERKKVARRGDRVGPAFRIASRRSQISTGFSPGERGVSAGLSEAAPTKRNGSVRQVSVRRHKAS
jgi:DNA-binding transcriptional MerR regulator